MVINILSMITVLFLKVHMYDDFKAAETSCNLQISTELWSQSGKFWHYVHDEKKLKIVFNLFSFHNYE